MSNQSYLKCEHTPLDEEDFDLHPNWKSGHVYNEEDEDGDIVEDEEDDCDIEDDDYCSDESSTTSTSSTNNQPDNTRVCDCCYCEVFGNGAAPVAPTSRNYNEMRERLRLRLSKRRAEKCERSIQQNGNISKDDSANDRGGGTQTSTNGINSGNKSNTPVVDQRNLDELLNYINGKGQKDQEKSSNKKKDKNKNNNNNKKSNNKNNSHTKSMHKEDKDFEKCNNQNHGNTNHNNNNNHHHHNHHYHPNSTGGDPTTSGNKRQQANNQNHHSSHSCSSPQQNQLENHQNNHRSSTIGNNRATPEVNSKQNTNLDQQHQQQQQQHDENYQPPQNSPTSNGKQKRKDREKSTSSKDQLLNKTQSNLSAKTISSSNGGSSHETCESNLETNHTTSTNANKQANTSNNQNFSINAATNTESINLSCHQNKKPPQATKKEPDDNNLSAPEDVFMPRDIDLNDGQLDELERELEAFKRFCFDSVPLVKKERVRVQLKDSNFFQELNERINNGSTNSNQQHAGTSRPLQAQMFRRKVSRI